MTDTPILKSKGNFLLTTTSYAFFVQARVTMSKDLLVRFFKIEREMVHRLSES